MEQSKDSTENQFHRLDQQINGRHFARRNLFDQPDNSSELEAGAVGIPQSISDRLSRRLRSLVVKIRRCGTSEKVGRTNFDAQK